MKKGASIDHCPKCQKIRQMGKWIRVDEEVLKTIKREVGFNSVRCCHCAGIGCDCKVCNCEEVYK